MIEMPAAPTNNWATIPLEVELQEKMSDERKVNSDGKHFEGLLATFDQRFPDGRLQSRRIDRYETGAQDDQDRQM